MTRDVLPDLADVLDGFTATLGAYTLTFEYVEWGRHYDRANYAAGNGLVTMRTLANPTRPSNIGGGALQNRQAIEVRLLFEDSASIPRLDEFKRAVTHAAADAIKTAEKAIGVSFYTNPEDVLDASDLIGEGTTVLRNELILMVRARAVDTY